MFNVSQAKLNNLEALLLNTSGNVPLHSRFRALFTLKALKSDEAVIIISKGHLLNASTSAGH
jgi:deoxyhypusine monooxygenase